MVVWVKNEQKNQLDCFGRHNIENEMQGGAKLMKQMIKKWLPLLWLLR